MKKLLLEEMINEEDAQPQENARGVVFDVSMAVLPEEGGDVTYTRAHFIAALVIVFVAAGAGFLLRNDALPKTGPTIMDTRAAKQRAESIVASRDHFAGVKLEARSAYVLDATTGKPLFEKNAHVRLPLASITKVMTALVATEESPRDTLITISPEDIEVEGDSGLRSSEQFRLRDILKLTLVGSSNDGAHAIAASVGRTLTHSEGDTLAPGISTPEKEFLLRMNERAQALGLLETSYGSATGLDQGEVQAGAYGSARDTAELFAYILKMHPEVFNETASLNVTVSSLASFRHTATNTNERVTDVPGIIASKTGYTTLAGGNLAIVLDAGIGRPIVVVALGSTAEGRFSDVETLARAALATISAERQ